MTHSIRIYTVKIADYMMNKMKNDTCKICEQPFLIGMKVVSKGTKYANHRYHERCAKEKLIID